MLSRSAAEISVNDLHRRLQIFFISILEGRHSTLHRIPGRARGRCEIRTKQRVCSAQGLSVIRGRGENHLRRNLPPTAGAEAWRIEARSCLLFWRGGGFLARLRTYTMAESLLQR